MRPLTRSEALRLARLQRLALQAGDTRLAKRYDIVMWLNKMPVRAIAKLFHISRNTLARWGREFERGGVDALRGNRRRGRTAHPLSPKLIEEVVTFAEPRPDGTRLTIRAAASLLGVSPATVQRTWAARANRTP